MVDAWAVRLDAATEASRGFRALLSPEEIVRADRFATEHLRTRYEVSHGVLRILLARYLKARPRELQFMFGRAGKPALCGGSRWQFNMSHSGGLAAYAFTRDCEIGLDIEEIRDMPDLGPVAEHYFCREEAGELLSVTGPQQRREAFFRCWTRKESYIKAIGEGLSVPLDQFQVTLLPDAPVRFVHIGGDAAAAAAWTLHHLEPAPGFAGALAYRGHPRHITLRPLQGAQEILELV